MEDLEHAMLAIYQATVPSKTPFVDADPLIARLGLTKKVPIKQMLREQGFLGLCPISAICLSESGIRYVEEHLLRR